MLQNRVLSLSASVLLSMATMVTSASAEKTVNLWHVFNSDTDMIHKGIKDFNEANPEINVEARVLPFAELRTEFIRSLTTGDVPDLVVINNPVTPGFSAQGALDDISDLVKASKVINPDDYYPGPWSTVVHKDGIYGVPRSSNTIAVYYNADMFKAAGLDPDSPPSTWAELRSAAEKLNNKEKNVFGIAFSAIQTEEGSFQFLPWVYQAGGSVSDIAGQPAVDALEYWTALVKDGLASRDVVNMRQFEGTNTFIAGNAAMAISGPWELPRIDKEAKFDWRVTNMPVRKGVDVEASALGGFNWSIPAGAKDRDEAFKFIEYMSSQPVLENAWATGRIPSRSGISTENPKWPAAFATFQKQMSSARPLGPHPRWPEISGPIQVAIQEALVGTKTPKEALDGAAAAIAPILKADPMR